MSKKNLLRYLVMRAWMGGPAAGEIFTRDEPIHPALVANVKALPEKADEDDGDNVGATAKASGIIESAKSEADRIIAKAKEAADKIIADAEDAAGDLVDKAKADADKIVADAQEAANKAPKAPVAPKG